MQPQTLFLELPRQRFVRLQQPLRTFLRSIELAPQILNFLRAIRFFDVCLLARFLHFAARALALGPQCFQLLNGCREPPFEIGDLRLDFRRSRAFALELSAQFVVRGAAPLNLLQRPGRCALNVLALAFVVVMLGCSSR